MCVKKREKTGQTSTEFVTLVVFFLLLIVGIVLGFYRSTTQHSEKMALEGASRTARMIADAANDVYIQGNGSVATANVPIPMFVENITIGGASEREIIFAMKTSYGRSDVVAITTANVADGARRLDTYKGAGVRGLNFTRSGDRVFISVLPS